MISVRVVWRWAALGNERAAANARLAATECSRRRVERAEVAQFLATYAEVEAATGVTRAAR